MSLEYISTKLALCYLYASSYFSLNQSHGQQTTITDPFNENVRRQNKMLLPETVIRTPTRCAERIVISCRWYNSHVR